MVGQTKPISPGHGVLFERAARPKRRRKPDRSPKFSQGNIRLTLRDLEILQALHSARFLTTPQIQALFWRESKGGIWGRQKACGRRLRMLTTSGLIRRIEQPIRRSEPSKPYIYALNKKGAELLVHEFGQEPQDIEWRPINAEANYPFLQHLLLTNDVRIAVLHACERHQLRLVEWVDERELKRAGMKDYISLVSADGRQQRAAVVPDAFFVVSAGSRTARFFVEVDNRSVVVSPSAAERRGFTRKIRAYLAYFNSEAYGNRYGGRPARVLTVTSGGERRLANLRQATESVGGGSYFYFTTFDLITPDQVLHGPIWQVAGAREPSPLLG